MQKAVFRYLGTLFKIGQEIFEHGQKAVKTDATSAANNRVSSAKVHELFNEESAIPIILHLTLVALLSAPIGQYY